VCELLHTASEKIAKLATSELPRLGLGASDENDRWVGLAQVNPLTRHAADRA